MLFRSLTVVTAVGAVADPFWLLIRITNLDLIFFFWTRFNAII